MLHLCVDTLKKKIAGAKNSKKRVLIFYQHNLRQGNSFTVKEKIRDSCKRYRNHVNSSSVYNFINKIKTKDFPQFNWPFSIIKPQFNRRIHNASSTSYLPSKTDMEEQSNHFVQTESLARKFYLVV